MNTKNKLALGDKNLNAPTINFGSGIRRNHIYPDTSGLKSAKSYQSMEINFRVLSSFHKDKVALYEQAANLKELMVTWVLVECGNQAQIYVCHKKTNTNAPWSDNGFNAYDKKTDYELAPVSNGIIGTNTKNDYQIDNDWNGTVLSRDASIHEFGGQQTDNAASVREHFMTNVAGRLAQACRKNLFDRLLLVASDKMIGELKMKLATDVLDRIVTVAPEEFEAYQNHTVMTLYRNVFAQSHAQ